MQQYVYVNPWSERQYSWEQGLVGQIPFGDTALPDATDIPTVTAKERDADVNQAKVGGLMAGAAVGVILTYILMRK